MDLMKRILRYFQKCQQGLAEDICRELGISLGRCEVGKFSDGEVFVNIDETVRGRDAMNSNPPGPVNDNLMEVLILVDALKGISGEDKCCDTILWLC